MDIGLTRTKTQMTRGQYVYKGFTLRSNMYIFIMVFILERINGFNRISMKRGP